ncbi:endonuclease/exonuclease/phosphatase family protein [Amycolatopsis sp. FBCC-B4732]|uniref:endonuclease/exonuclease/phosphatase family protein n=1 Tax=Amycolatopsis sp. FBCC-B4732 TaxID=3079339 RepID=UPI001FF0E6F5|nr:endonuclease/exonuclease/phosphatase family protein [Amycolatopsis sp. FBCC-B4732]UOX90008.1 endonuclease/exonuclease/phosphatase family protein [Amycolatopsis sp. FBCC-B4732]
MTAGAGSVKLATWNIGGGVLGPSHQSGGEPSLGYHASILAAHSPDVVCLQEAHDYRGRGESQPDRLARELGYPYVASFPVCESHLDENAALALAILSRFPVLDVVGTKLPNPGLTWTGPDGTPWTLADKGYVTAVVDLGDREIGILNGHCFPLHYFGASPLEARFAPGWEALGADLMAMKAERSAFAALDLNHEPVHSVLRDVLGADGYATAFENTPTTPKGVQQDYILYDSAVRMLTSTVAGTRADHFYCEAGFLV